MHLSNLIKIAIRSISNNKLRGFLTMLGIIIGVASVIAMLAIGQGSKRSIQMQISEMGSNLMMIQPGNGQFGGVRQSAGNMQTLTLEDYEALVEQSVYLTNISPTVNSSGQFVYGSNNTPSSLNGVNEEFLDIRRYTIEKGSMFARQDIKSAAKVCVVGQTVVNNLFTNGEEPLGQTIRFNKIPLKIVGVLASKGYNSMGQDQDDLVLTPFTTVQKRILAITHIQGINASVVTEQATEQASEEVSNILRNQHKLKLSDEDDFQVRSQQERRAMLTSTTDMMTVLLACIAGISLLVGGIGIMNIMYVTVTERTREIGLRMSIGAKGRHILMQFLIEAIMISVTGGILGVIVGVGSSFAIRILFAWPIYVQPYSVILSFAVCTFTGVFFGWYPAQKASRLDPIEAIRYE